MKTLDTKSERLLRDLSRDPGILILAYPYARSWHPISQERVRETWSAVGQNERAALYIHVPFCHRKCKYCDFLAYYGRPEADLERYLTLLKQDIRQTAEVAGHALVESMEFGGGTPSLMSPAQVVEILGELKRCFRFTPDAQFTMEVFPDSSVTQELLMGWRRAGINRLSFGIQSLDDELKRRMNRTDTCADILRILRETPAAGYEDHSVDLICGLPDQSDESWRHTYREILRLKPPHLCVFPVSVRHQGIALFNQRRTLPPSSRSRQMYEEACRHLAEAGYERTTRHNFRLGAHDCTYERLMARQMPLIGLGAHSVSRSKNCMYKNYSHLGKYAEAVARGEMPVQTGYVFPREEQPNDYAVRQIEYLRLDGLDFKARFGSSLRDVFPEEIGLLEEFGLGRICGNDLELTHDGVYYTAAVKRLFFHPSAWERFENMKSTEFRIERGMFDTVENLASMPA